MSSKIDGKVAVKKEILVEDFKFILKDLYLRIGTVDEVLSASRNALPADSKTAITTGSKVFNPKIGEKRYFSQAQMDNSETEVVGVKNNHIQSKTIKSKTISAKSKNISKKRRTKPLKAKKSKI